tara:strand:- start:218 stop:478 length:261 start_codon:yes stop_codon:yes gene_type:complete
LFNIVLFEDFGTLTFIELLEELFEELLVIDVFVLTFGVDTGNAGGGGGGGGGGGEGGGNAGAFGKLDGVAVFIGGVDAYVLSVTLK